MIIHYKGKTPWIHSTAFVAPNACLIGQVRIGRESSIWFGAVLRGDINQIIIGHETNVQDNCVLHVESNLQCVLGNGIVVGHQATIHASRIEDGSLIGIGSRILNGAVVGKHSIVGAGAVVLENSKIPPYSLVVGTPAKVVRRVTKKEVDQIRKGAVRYKELGIWYRDHLESFSGHRDLLPLHDLSRIF